MNVSSVKNLNGEVFSAVQDASLTNVVQTNSSTWNNVTNKLDTTAFSDVSGTFLTAVDLTPYQTIEGMTAYQPVGDYATTAEVDTLSSMLSAAIDYVSANAGDEFPVSADEAIQYVQTNSAQIDDTVTSYQTNSGTFLTEPNLEYNAVNEISGYNGSAIAQYGAEKQWLQHDDTIVHVTNSAQYAFGCNISALQRLMGIDETVLWEGEALVTSSHSVINLSESMFNFNNIKIEDRSWSVTSASSDVYYPTKITTLHLTNSSTVFGTNDVWADMYSPLIAGSHYMGNNYYSAGVGGNTIVTLGSYIRNCTNTAGSYQYRGRGKIVKVIGIGRKEV